VTALILTKGVLDHVMAVPRGHGPDHARDHAPGDHDLDPGEKVELENFCQATGIVQNVVTISLRETTDVVLAQLPSQGVMAGMMTKRPLLVVAMTSLSFALSAP